MQQAKAERLCCKMFVTWSKITVIQYFILQQRFKSYHMVQAREVASEAANSAKLSSLHIDKSLNNLRQDDPKLIDILKFLKKKLEKSCVRKCVGVMFLGYLDQNRFVFYSL